MVWSGAYGYADLTEKRVMTMNTVCSAVWNDFGRLKFTIINQATLAVRIYRSIVPAHCLAVVPDTARCSAREPPVGTADARTMDFTSS